MVTTRVILSEATDLLSLLSDSRSFVAPLLRMTREEEAPQDDTSLRALSVGSYGSLPTPKPMSDVLMSVHCRRVISRTVPHVSRIRVGALTSGRPPRTSKQQPAPSLHVPGLERAFAGRIIGQRPVADETPCR